MFCRRLNFVIIFGAAILITIGASVMFAGYDEDFQQASNLDNYSGITNIESARLTINLASVVHQENLQIIKLLRDLQKSVNELKASGNLNQGNRSAR